jgi:hypothetical protein
MTEVAARIAASGRVVKARWRRSQKSIEDEEQNINTSKLQTVRSDGLFEITHRDLLISDCAKQLSYSAT